MFSYYAKWIKKFSQKIRPLVQSNLSSSFPLSREAFNSFENPRNDLAGAFLTSIDEKLTFVVECDASEHTLAATLNQGGKPVPFHSLTFSNSKSRYLIVEKEATAIINAVRKWNHLLHGRKFTLVTDQKAVSFMLHPKRLGKIKNSKIQMWRAEFGHFDYDVKHLPGKSNLAPDALSRACLTIPLPEDLSQLPSKLEHPGFSRLFHIYVPIIPCTCIAIEVLLLYHMSLNIILQNVELPVVRQRLTILLGTPSVKESIKLYGEPLNCF